MMIGDLPLRAAARWSDKRAIIGETGSVTFAELERLSGRFAVGLAARGVRAGDRVTLYGENGWEWAAAYYGIARAGAVINPVNALLTADELAFIVADCGSRLIVTSSTAAARIRQIKVPKIVYGAPASGFGELFEAVLAEEAAGASQGGDEGDLSTICYTSGTTGRPKGAMLSHRAVVTNTRMTVLMHGRDDRDVVLSALPCAHVYGNVVMNASVFSGATLVLLARFEAAAVAAAMKRYGATMFEGVPTMYHYLLSCPEFRSSDWAGMRLCTVGGQTISPAVMAEVEQILGCPLIELWGMTELAGLGTTHPHTGPARLGSIGLPLPFLEARIADPEQPETTLADGERGELLVRGPIMMNGYHGSPDETMNAITESGWLHTGDIGYRDPDGYFYVVDRKNDVILSGGYNIYPAEVERVIADHAAVSMVAVGSARDDAKGEVARAYVVVKAGSSVTEDEIISHCQGRLAKFKHPRSVRFVADLPKTSTGKVLRRGLRTLDERGEAKLGESA